MSVEANLVVAVGLAAVAVLAVVVVSAAGSLVVAVVASVAGSLAAVALVVDSRTLAESAQPAADLVDLTQVASRGICLSSVVSATLINRVVRVGKAPEASQPHRVRIEYTD